MNVVQSNGAVDVHINLDHTAQSEPRIRLQLAENLLRETHSLIHRLEVRSFTYIKNGCFSTIKCLNKMM